MESDKKCSKCRISKRKACFRMIRKRDMKYESNICEDCIASRQKARKDSYKEYKEILPI
jgi:hypothetical protein